MKPNTSLTLLTFSFGQRHLLPFKLAPSVSIEGCWDSRFLVGSVLAVKHIVCADIDHTATDLSWRVQMTGESNERLVEN